MGRNLDLLLTAFDGDPSAKVEISLTCGGRWIIISDVKGIFKEKSGGYIQLGTITELDGTGPARRGIIQIPDFVCESATGHYSAQIVEDGNKYNYCEIDVSDALNLSASAPEKKAVSKVQTLHTQDLRTLSLPLQTNYFFHERLQGLSLGAGFDPRDPTVSKRRSLDFVEQLVEKEGSIDLNISYVRSVSEFNQSMRTDSVAEARFDNIGGFTNSQSRQFSETSHSDSISLVLTAVINYGKWAIGAHAQLVADASNALRQPAQFANAFGSRYVSEVIRGASLHVVITLQSVDRERRDSFTSEFSGGGGWGSLSASAKSKFNSEMRVASRQSRLEIQVAARGAKNPTQLVGLLHDMAAAEGDQLANMIDELGKLLSTFDRQEAATLEYMTGSFSEFGLDLTTVPKWTLSEEQCLQEIARNQVRYEIAFDTLVGIRDNTTLLSRLLTKDRAAVLDDLDWVQEFLRGNRSAYALCLQGESAKSCERPRTRGLLIESIAAEYALSPNICWSFFSGGTENYSTTLSLPKTSAILNSDKNRRGDVARAFDSQLSSPIKIAFYLRAVYPLTTCTLQVVDSDGVLWGEIAHPVPAPWLYGDLWWQENNSSDGMEEVLYQWHGNSRGLHHTTVRWKVVDMIGREFLIDFMDVTVYVDKWGNARTYETRITL